MHSAESGNVKAILARLVGSGCVREERRQHGNLGFGHEHEVDLEHTVPEISLHLQCPWRIEGKTGGGIVTGFLTSTYEHRTTVTNRGSREMEQAACRSTECLSYSTGAGSRLKTNKNTAGNLLVMGAELLPSFSLGIDLKLQATG